MPEVKKRDHENMIHGSFKELDYYCMPNAGELHLPKTNKKMIERIDAKVEVISEDVPPNPIEIEAIVKIVDGFPISKSLLENCKNVRMLIIGDGCNTELMQGLVFDSMPNLERVEIGKNCFSKVASFHVQHCPKLRRVFIGDGSFTNCMDCVIESNPELLELQLGGNAGVSISKP